ncbi:unnamed protein product [Adineta steineri]|uniref:G-protein coupled receptors family 1 profile domain-containing protein n=1 Tax=Adineta steineri TaxID=433720 RepID=A0A818SM79_9BILA|nr:unnamed protein product [Adineta steineri]CAF3674725.1 unnamed protein product [Adineta steineri]
MINTVEFILNCITLVIGICTWMVILMILMLIVYYLFHNRIKQEEKMTIIHGINMYILLLIFITISISFNIQTMLGDLNKQNFNSFSCILAGYFVIVSINSLYYIFFNQALFRLCRIVYSTYGWIQLSWIHIILSPIEIILICILYSPAFVWHDIVYLTKEYYCFIDYTNLRLSLWVSFNTYGIPLCLLMLVYLRITIFIRQQSNNLTWLTKKRQQQDLIVIRRIFIILSLLIIIGLPTIILMIRFYITGKLHPLFYRILWFSVTLSMMILTITMIILTPQLKKIVFKYFRHNRVIPINRTLQNQNQQRYITTIL